MSCGGDDPHIHRNRAGSPYGLHFTLLKGAEDFGLHIKRHISDLIQKESAAIGQLEFTGLPAFPRTSKGSVRIAKQLGFQKLAGDRGTVDTDHGLIRTIAGVMNGAGKKLFACTRLPGEQNSKIRPGGLQA